MGESHAWRMFVVKTRVVQEHLAPPSSCNSSAKVPETVLVCHAIVRHEALSSAAVTDFTSANAAVVDGMHLTAYSVSTDDKYAFSL